MFTAASRPVGAASHDLGSSELPVSRNACRVLRDEFSFLALGREPVQDEFLHNTAKHALARGKQEILEHQSRAAVRRRIVEVGKSSRA